MEFTYSGVAVGTQEATHLTGLVAVIYRQLSFELGAVPIADLAATILEEVHGVVLLRGDSIPLPKGGSAGCSCVTLGAVVLAGVVLFPLPALDTFFKWHN